MKLYMVALALLVICILSIAAYFVFRTSSNTSPDVPPAATPPKSIADIISASTPSTTAPSETPLTTAANTTPHMSEEDIKKLRADIVKTYAGLMTIYGVFDSHPNGNAEDSLNKWIADITMEIEGYKQLVPLSIIT
jgi:uncharacterized protein YegL